MSIAAPCVVATYVDRKNESPYSSETLYTAAKSRDSDRSLAVTKHLLSLNADPNAPYSTYGDTPLQWAAEQKHPRVVEALLEAGANPRATDPHGTTALHYASDIDSVRALLEGGADPKAANLHGSTPFSSAVSRGFSKTESSLEIGGFAVAKLLAEAGASVHFEQKDLVRCSILGARKLIVLAGRRGSAQNKISSLFSLLKTYTGQETYV